MSNEKCIVIGASHAGTSLALQLRREGWTGQITLIGAEPELPYHRPPLSKDYLSGKKELDGMRLRPEQAFADNDVELKLGQKVVAIDAAARTVQLDDGSSESYDKLALCVGSSPRQLPIQHEFDNVHYLRTADDACKLRGKLAAGQKAVVIGAGYIGLEIAAVMRELGLEVTVLEREATLLPRVSADVMAGYLQKLHESHGVQFRFATTVTDLKGEGRVTHVVCNDGAELAADVVIAGIGIEPNLELAEQAGLAIDRGIVVDEYTQTSDENIFAAGDCAVHPSLIYGRLLRLESVQNANDQARTAAANICGKHTVYDAVPWFWSDQYDIKLQSTGLLQGFDEFVIRGDSGNLSEGGFAVFYFRQGKVIAAECVARPKEFMAAKQLVKSAAQISPELLADESLEPASWLK